MLFVRKFKPYMSPRMVLFVFTRFLIWRWSLILTTNQSLRIPNLTNILQLFTFLGHALSHLHCCSYSLQEGAGRNTEETCTTYNMMKIARYLFQWTGDARYADYYERAVLNGMLGVQRMPANYTSCKIQRHPTDVSTTRSSF